MVGSTWTGLGWWLQARQTECAETSSQTLRLECMLSGQSCTAVMMRRAQHPH